MRRADLSWKEIDDEVIVLDLRSSQYLTTNASGTLVWRHLVDGATFVELVAAVEDHFGVAEEIAARDVATFCSSLDDLGLLEVHER